ncbi:Sphingoid long chain base kinase 4 [Psilocybe cubensis]|uniref:Sphingoid long chain base kinase 4 n=1 Tax=Psilocybe cubensis TaxID=181762 RepID=A0ACB8H8R1_PSICU|nr:Sphingoid long chain base kinase 4 [Psilocybe cubensis]KAH9484246.1 Sphingoid long chain base kinase 4 [Psilocybe cubensis]
MWEFLIPKAKQASHHRHDIPHRSVLKASFDSSSKTVCVAYVDKKKKRHKLVILEGAVREEEASFAGEWTESVMKLAYEDFGVKRSRKLMIFVNPFGGTGKGATIFATKIEPLLKTAGCVLEVLYTTHRGQARDVSSKLSLDFDAVLTVSGDGLIHEVLNGFSEHSNPRGAFAIPICPIPTGSGNGLSLNLLGYEDGFDVVAAALNAVKGKPMNVDLFSFTQGERRSISFMSQAMGLMADLDIGTEHLRWMGDSRFLYGFLRGIIAFKPCPVQLSYRLVESDKNKMAEFAHSKRAETTTISSSESQVSELESKVEGAMPTLKYLPDDEDGWTTFDKPVLYVYAGKGPYVGRDFMAFPVSLPNDGLIDVAAMIKSTRGDMIASMDGAPEGVGYWLPNIHYAKVHAYRIKPLHPKGCLAVDGEAFPFEPFQVEVHQAVKLDAVERQGLDDWKASPPRQTFVDGLNVEHLSDLYITLPTRDGSKRPYEAPELGDPLPYGHHLAFFHARRSEEQLRKDGTDEDISPPAPFTKRMWAGGKILWKNDNPLLVGKRTMGVSTVAGAEEKGFDKGKPMVFITQKIEFTQEGQRVPSVVEERAHVYFHAEIFSNRKKVFDRAVNDIPTTVDFSFEYTPTPITLFRYSALMFNAHHIHLDKEYCEKEEGYPERVVHGPLTAQMLLETVNIHFPDLKFQKFEYRATNPLFVNRKLTINGKWVDKSNILVWCSDMNGIVGMTGKVLTQ